MQVSEEKKKPIINKAKDAAHGGNQKVKKVRNVESAANDIKQRTGN